MTFVEKEHTGNLGIKHLSQRDLNLYLKCMGVASFARSTGTWLTGPRQWRAFSEGSNGGTATIVAQGLGATKTEHRDYLRRIENVSNTRVRRLEIQTSLNCNMRTRSVEAILAAVRAVLQPLARSPRAKPRLAKHFSASYTVLNGYRERLMVWSAVYFVHRLTSEFSKTKYNNVQNALSSRLWKRLHTME